MFYYCPLKNCECKYHYCPCFTGKAEEEFGCLIIDAIKRYVEKPINIDNEISTLIFKEKHK